MGVFMEGLLEAPLWIQIWVGWMMVINTMAFLFLKHREGRIIAIVWVINGISMMLAAEVLGYNRLLGLVHIIYWTPLLVFMFRSKGNVEASTGYGRWLYLLMITIAVSLVIDYIDVVRYALGDRG